MPLAAPLVESRLSGHAGKSRPAQGLAACMPTIDYTPARATTGSLFVETPSLAMQASAPSVSLAARVQLLIKTGGGVGAIARRCGFSEGAVRSWRDGYSDISRERCVVLAQALGISLLWLVAGEGCMAERASGLSTGAPAGEATALPMPGLPASSTDARTPAIDPRRLAAALKLLQSYIGLIGGSLTSLQRADALAELYDILGGADDLGHTDRLIAFQTALNLHLRRNHSLIA
jgi:hypothetical protein